MTRRLLLGGGAVLERLAQSVHEQSGSLQVGTDDPETADALTERGIPVVEFEQFDQAICSGFEPPDIVGVFDERRERTESIARIAGSVFPNAQLISYAGWSAEASLDGLASLSDRVVDPAEALTDHLSARIGDRGQRMRQLQQVLREIDRLAVVTHDNPDPDALASALALARIAQAAGCPTEVCYYGEITHQENRAFINVLGMELRNLGPEDDLSEFDGVALVDHSRPSVNDQLPADLPIDIVIDHHPPRSPVDARFVDLRSSVGATSTLLVDYLDRFNIDFDEDLATALLFGIHVDTDGFSREISQEDFTAAARLVPTVNFGTLDRIESPSISPRTFGTIADAIQNRRVEGSVLMSCVGALSERDALAQAADRLLNMEGITTVLVYGIKDEQIFVSARARGAGIDLGETLRDAFGQIGSAGGHVDMAGAQIKLGLLGATDERDDSLHDVIEEIVASRFLDVLDADVGATATSPYATESEIDAEYLGEDSPEEGRNRWNDRPGDS
ncbi:bifunctional oligoribonuclease/PAP phosphatase NrnA [Halovenus sp. WSH3]|uniref:Bifunctional oligoribonuclease/PAP phosphatase NrnA n=1 Tax=Halovenus carboxidivorans TaxID=2692199 RepID=A0A6B0T1V5_9EURY|nr:DHHA1 domain-containing protein [Halovenus carboxidivorans]MXR51137.1 bifunctional oligoribonuclease/PAP phosphatase NrnA [Halovenus carboxidivorans]